MSNAEEKSSIACMDVLSLLIECSRSLQCSEDLSADWVYIVIKKCCKGCVS